MNFHLLLSVLAARWRVGLGVFLACVAISAVITLRSPKLYTAQAQIVVDLSGNSAADAGANQGTAPESMQTQINIITSPAVAGSVVKKLKFDEDPAMKAAWHEATKGRGDFEGWLAESLIGTLTVEPPVEGNVVKVSATWSDPAFAAKLANFFVDAYIETGRNIKVTSAKNTTSFLEEQGRDAKLDLEKKQKAYSDYLRKEGIASANEGAGTENTSLSQMSDELVRIQNRVAESRAKWLQARDHSDSSPEVLNNGIITGLKGQLLAAEANQKTIATQLGANHPQRVESEATIAKYKASISAETATIVQRLQSELEADQAREKLVRANISGQNRRAGDQRQVLDRAAILKKEVDAAQATMDGISAGYAKNNMESQTTLSNASILSMAKEPSKPSSPKYKMNFMMGFLGGLALAIGAILGLEKIDQRLRIDSEIPDLLGVPLLATFSSQKMQTAAPLLMMKAMAAKALGVREAKALPNWTQ